MNRQEQVFLACKISAVSIFRKVAESEQISILVKFLLTDESNVLEKLDLLGKFIYSLSNYNCCFSDFLKHAICSDDNTYISIVAQRKTVPQFIYDNIQKELELFSNLTDINTDSLRFGINYDGYIPVFSNNHTDFIKMYEEKVRDINKFGYGIFASSAMFRIYEKKIIPIKSADTISPNDFIGYNAQRNAIFNNTRALCNGKPAANALLYGDSGTGKSSTVKACANYFYKEGVRLIELRKDQILSLPHVMETIKDNPLKFIIFIDDISFNDYDDAFSMLKATLEGSASVKADNAVIYVTSNRRHIIKESFSDRHGDDIHKNDTIQELTSLSERFGLSVYFEKPDRKLFLEIVRELAKKKGIVMDKTQLCLQAEVYALDRGGRSPRIAEQFVNSLI